MFNYIFAVIITVFAIIFVLTTYWFSQWRTNYIRAMNNLDNKKRQLGVDALLNSDTVKEYVNEEYERNRYAAKMMEFQKKQIGFTMINTVTDLIQSLILTIGFGLGCSLCIKMVLNHSQGLTAGDYVLLSTYMLQVFEPLFSFGMLYKNFVSLFVDMENMLEIFRLQPEIRDSMDAIPFNVQHGEVEFKNVIFGYSPDKIVLNNVSFKVPAGHTFAIVGPSGAGKTSIVKLLLRLFEPGSGEILFDGMNIRNMKIRHVRNQIGVVPQDTILFNDTIRYNINYGKPSAQFADVMEAAKSACLHDKIVSFPDQYDTMVGERGMKVSGGEKQRVAIARLILKNPKIIILDEATSALDTRTERNIQSTLSELSQNRTCVVVAHRLSTIVNANCILVLDAGRVVESGTHAELMEKNGIYAQMWEAQFKELDETKQLL